MSGSGDVRCQLDERAKRAREPAALSRNPIRQIKGRRSCFIAPLGERLDLGGAGLKSACGPSNQPPINGELEVGLEIAAAVRRSLSSRCVVGGVIVAVFVPCR
jgi:hypothetical protein